MCAVRMGSGGVVRKNTADILKYYASLYDEGVKCKSTAYTLEEPIAQGVRGMGFRDKTMSGARTKGSRHVAMASGTPMDPSPHFLQDSDSESR